MKKILSLVLIFTCGFLFSGCNIPFYTQYQVKKYLNRTEPDFLASKDEFGKIKEAIFAESPQYEESKKAVDSAVEKIKTYNENLNQKNPPPIAQDLEANLKNYYQDLFDFADEIKLMIGFLYLAEKTSDDLIASADKLPSDFNQKLTKLIQEFTQSKKDYQSELNDLESKEVPESFYQAKIALISVLEAYIDFLNSVTRGLKEKNTYYFDIDQFVRQMDDGISKFTSQIEVIEGRSDFDKKVESFSKKQGELEKQIQDLKDKYKIK